MEQLPNGFSMEIPRNSFPLSTDSMGLADFVKLGRNADVLDLGSGCGTLGLLLCAADSGCTVTGLEITPQAHNAAEENIRRNGLQTRYKSICADLRNLSEIFPAGSFSVCVSNPPYFSGGPASSRLPAARRDDCCTPDDLFEAARWALRYGGDFFLVHRPEKLAQLIACGAARGLEAKTLQLVCHRQNDPVSLVLLQFRKGGKPGLKITQEHLFDIQGNPTPYHQRVYHTQEVSHGRNSLSGPDTHR